MALQLMSPDVPQEIGDITGSNPASYDQLNYTLNAVQEIPYAVPSFNRASSAIWQYPDVGLYDNQYNMGYKQVFVDNQVTSLDTRYESPNVPVTHMAWQESLFNTTLVQQQAGDILLQTSMRAPAINEGFAG